MRKPWLSLRLNDDGTVSVTGSVELVGLLLRDAEQGAFAMRERVEQADTRPDIRKVMTGDVAMYLRLCRCLERVAQKE